MYSASMLLAILTLASTLSFDVDGYIHSRTPLTIDDLFISSETTKHVGRIEHQHQYQQRTVPEILNHSRKRYESSAPSSSHLVNDSRPEEVAAVSGLPLTISQTVTMSPLEAWCLSHLDHWYSQSQSMKCPFLRRRLGDFFDNVETVMKHTLIRRECWPLMGPPQAWRPAGHNKKINKIKYKHLSMPELMQYVYDDWKPESKKGYYVTGKLTTAIYRDDCLFLGPDPDMPIRGLRKYIGVAAHLFDFNESESTLKSLEIIGETLVAEWQLKGILKLPWRPHLPTFCGKTVYSFDKDGLIEKHEEFWNMAVSHAFCETLFPKLAAKIWKEPLTSTV